MTNNELIDLLQKDLANERKHLAFYLQSSTMVTGLHRAELREFLFEEAQGELKHIEEFSRLIVYLGGIPNQTTNDYPVLSSPIDILTYVVEMEQEVADIYAERLCQTHEMNTSSIYVHLFYEDQLSDSQKTAWEVAKMIEEYKE